MELTNQKKLFLHTDYQQKNKKMDLTAIKKIGYGEPSNNACKDAYGLYCRSFYPDPPLIPIDPSTKPKNKKRIVQLSVEVKSVSDGKRTTGRKVRFSFKNQDEICACSRVYFYILYEKRLIEFNGEIGAWIDIYDAPIVTDIGATTIIVPML